MAQVITGVAVPTTIITGADVLVRKLLSPLKTALIVWLPTPRLLTFSVATPLESVDVPMVVAPSSNVTVSAPAGVSVPTKLVLSVAVRTTCCPYVGEFKLVPKSVDVDIGDAASDTAFDVLELKFVSPAYVASSEWLPPPGIEIIVSDAVAVSVT